MTTVTQTFDKAEKYISETETTNRLDEETITN